MFKPRALTDIQQALLTSLLQQNTPLSDVSPGSALYTLVRATAATQLQQDLALGGLVQSFFLTTSTASDLDARAADYGLSRKAGDYAAGSVLARSQTEGFNVSAGLVLTDPVTGLQFEVNINNSSAITSFAETKLLITATTLGVRSNLLTGTRLVSPTFPQGLFLVGDHRTTAQQICGDLSGGRDTETDDELRLRLTTSILNSRGTTEGAIRSVLLAQPTVPWVAVTTPKGGIIQVWVDNASTLTTLQLQSLQTIANLAKPAGTLLYVHQALRTLADINVYVKPDYTIDLHLLATTIISLVNNYLSELQLGAPLLRADLLKVLFVPGVLEANVLAPAQDVTPDPFGVVRANKSWVTYDAS